jgi:hypothetical protein
MTHTEHSGTREIEPMLPDALKDRIARWRTRALEMRAVADTMNDPTLRRQLFETAEIYEQMADEADRVERSRLEQGRSIPIKQ